LNDPELKEINNTASQTVYLNQVSIQIVKIALQKEGRIKLVSPTACISTLEGFRTYKLDKLANWPISTGIDPFNPGLNDKSLQSRGISKPQRNMSFSPQEGA